MKYSYTNMERTKRVLSQVQLNSPRVHSARAQAGVAIVELMVAILVFAGIGAAAYYSLEYRQQARETEQNNSVNSNTTQQSAGSPELSTNPDGSVDNFVNALESDLATEQQEEAVTATGESESTDDNTDAEDATSNVGL